VWKSSEVQRVQAHIDDGCKVSEEESGSDAWSVLPESRQA